MSQEFKDREHDATENLTDEEVEAIIKRYGESQSGGDTQPTVKDVAEALHVEPSVVSQILSDVRGAKTQEDLKSRLDSLEAENAELRVKAEKSDYHANEMWNDYSGFRPLARARSRSGPGIAVILALVFGAMFVFRGAGAISRPTSMIWILLGVFALVFILRRFRNFKR